MSMENLKLTQRLHKLESTIDILKDTNNLKEKEMHLQRIN